MGEILSKITSQHSFNENRGVAQQTQQQNASVSNKIAGNNEAKVDQFQKIQATLEEASKKIQEYKITVDEIKEVAREFYTQLVNNQLCIRYDILTDLDNELVVKMVKRGNGQVVWQFPPSVDIAIKELAKQMPGILIDTSI